MSDFDFDFVPSFTKRRRNVKKFNKHWTGDMELGSVSNTEVFLANSDLTDHIATRIMTARYDQDTPTLAQEVAFLCNKNDWISHILKLNWKVYELTQTRGVLVNEETNDFVRFESHPTSIKLEIYANQAGIDFIIDYCSQKFERVECYIQWMYSGGGDTIDVPLRPDKLPISEMYPFLGDETLTEYYDRFMDSDSSILLLIGPPGTGKTSFIRGLLQHRKTSAVVTYDAGILDKDYVFARFIESESEIMVLEDADTFLKSRKEGNTMMHKFLNVGDGLVTTKGKKLIFSTNLPSIKDIDPALTRPGRCFDIVTFDPLTPEQAQRAAKKLNITIPKKKAEYSIAELFHQQTHAVRHKESKIGFI